MVITRATCDFDDNISTTALSLADNHMQVTHEKVIHAEMFANFLVEIWGEGGGPPFL